MDSFLTSSVYIPIFEWLINFSISPQLLFWVFSGLLYILRAFTFQETENLLPLTSVGLHIGCSLISRAYLLCCLFSELHKTEMSILLHFFRCPPELKYMCTINHKWGLLCSLQCKGATGNWVTTCSRRKLTLHQRGDGEMEGKNSMKPSYSSEYSFSFPWYLVGCCHLQYFPEIRQLLLACCCSCGKTRA